MEVETSALRGPRTAQVTAAGSSSENSGYRSIQTSSATFSSMRARCEPRHRCTPSPNAEWRFTSRSMSTWSASSNSSGSRLADGNDNRIQSSAFIGQPFQSMSSLTRRAMVTGA
jgi:hypothetical protein